MSPAAGALAGILLLAYAGILPAAGSPGQPAAERLGTTAVDLDKPPAYVPDIDDLDELGPGSATDSDRLLRRLGLKPAGDHRVPEAGAGETLQLSLEQAVMLGLEHNRSLRVQQLNPVIAGTFADIERAVFDPTLFAQANYAEESAQQISRATGEIFSVKGSDISVSAGVSETLPTGTDLELSIEQTHSESSRTPKQNTTRAGLTLTQALLRGAGLDVNLARIRQAQVDALTSVYELRGFTENLVASIESTYWDYVLARRRIDIYTSALEVARQQLDETQKRIKVGQLPETELAAARAEVALRQQDLIDARSRQETVRLTLLQLLNVSSDAGWSRRVTTTTRPAIRTVPLDQVGDRIALALRLRPELNQARLELEHGRLQVVQTRNGLLPQLDLFLTLGKSGYADSFGDAVNDISGPSYDVAAGVRLELPVFNRAAEARQRGALATRDQARESLENLAQLVSLDVRKAYVEVQRSRDQIEASAATRALQEEVLRAEQTKFRVGNATAFSVSQAQRDFIESQIGEVQALVTYRKALIELYRLEGSLLKRRGIRAPGSEMVNVLSY